MFQQTEILGIASALARHATQRQSLIAENVANADTPGYRRRDLESFAETYDRGAQARMHATRHGHFQTFAAEAGGFRVARTGGGMSPNGNDVSLEDEMVRAASIRQDHDMALSVYRASLGVLRASLGRG
ncbi:FlgB family protein [Albidovulum sediminis]|uniref:FlgB family protein n=1 Tax=Albidovulum sediminis TaxID=3066345 RepID=A0ABT2NRX9_9RHOB|nr:FlgB family protein [Defluviimonas sediminis]MCT8331706.1 FlgB family protein [Defluviimonas sediminis]